MPSIGVTGVRGSEQDNDTDRQAGIDQAVVQDARGNLFNVYAADLKGGKKRLRTRGAAAKAIADSRAFIGLGFAVDDVLAFAGPQDDGDISSPAVLLTTHPDGVSRSLELLTLDDCASVGTVIGTIHRLRPDFIASAGYPAYTTGQIHAQLTAWIKRLRSAGHVPAEITDSWAAILETDGMWSFATCPVHGGFTDGDFIFSGSTITTVTNWQEMQINDPARDLAWIFSKLDETHRNAVLAAYGRILGNRLDDLIMLRANLWVQMEQVGEFIQALNRGDSNSIMQFKAQVDRLAHQIGVTHHRNEAAGKRPARHPEGEPSTVTVNTLLREDVARDAAQAAQAALASTEAAMPAPAPAANAAAVPSSATAPVAPFAADDTNSAAIVASAAAAVAALTDSTGEAIVADATGESDVTGQRPSAGQGAATDATSETDVALAAVDVVSGYADEIAQSDDTGGMFGLTYSQMVEGAAHRAESDAIAAAAVAQAEAEAKAAAQSEAESEEAEVIAAESRAVAEAAAEAESREADRTGSSPAQRRHDSASSSTTIHLDVEQAAETPEGSGEASDATPTMLIPLLEREERAMRDAKAGLEMHGSGKQSR